MRLIDMTGLKCGRLSVIGRDKTSKNGNVYWLCRCDCGNIRSVCGTLLRNGETVSCGCYGKDRVREVNRTHGGSRTRLYNVYKDMLARCYYPKDHAYSSYGGRGITVCDEWRGKDGFNNFREWAMANGYNPNAPHGECTLDRIDNDKGYSPDNCRWVDMKIQANNRRSNHLFTIAGKIKTVEEWANIYGVDSKRLLYQIRHGADVEQWLIKHQTQFNLQESANGN